MITSDIGASRNRALAWWRASLVRDVVRHAEKVDFNMKALALSAQLSLSAAPALIAAAAIVKRVRGADLVQLLSVLFGLHGSALFEIHQLFRVPGHPDPEGQATGLLVAALFATAAAATMQRCFEEIWLLPAATWHAKWRQVAWVVATIPFFTLSIRLATAMGKVTISPTVDAVLAPLWLGFGSFTFFWWSQHLLLRGRVRWRDLLPGSLFIGLGMIGLSVIGQYTGSNQVADAVSTYGLVAAGLLFILMIWGASLVVLAGALLGAVLHRRRLERHA